MLFHGVRAILWFYSLFSHFFSYKYRWEPLFRILSVRKTKILLLLYALRVTGFALPVARYVLRFTRCALRIVLYALRVAHYVLRLRVTATCD